MASAIKRRKTAIRRCYEEALRSDSGVGGKLLVEFTVGSRGRVTSSRVVKDTTKSSSVGSCLLRRLGQWRFPVPDDGNSVTVRYPFVFSRKNLFVPKKSVLTSRDGVGVLCSLIKRMIRMELEDN